MKNEDGRVVDVRARDVRISFGVDVLTCCTCVVGCGVGGVS